MIVAAFNLLTVSLYQISYFDFHNAQSEEHGTSELTQPKKPTRIMVEQGNMRRQVHEHGIDFPELDLAIDVFTENHELNLTELRDLLKSTVFWEGRVPPEDQ